MPAMAIRIDFRLATLSFLAAAVHGYDAFLGYGYSTFLTLIFNSSDKAELLGLIVPGSVYSGIGFTLLQDFSSLVPDLFINDYMVRENL